MLNSVIKNADQYQSSLRKGYNQDRSAVKASSSDSGEKGERVRPYEEWTKEELYEEARKVGVPGRSYMNKKSLIKSLRAN